MSIGKLTFIHIQADALSQVQTTKYRRMPVCADVACDTWERACASCGLPLGIRGTGFCLLLTHFQDFRNGRGNRGLHKPRDAKPVRREVYHFFVSNRKIRSFSREQPTLASGKCLELQLSSTEVGFLFWRWNQMGIRLPREQKMTSEQKMTRAGSRK
jgi:hypothetical protein